MQQAWTKIRDGSDSDSDQIFDLSDISAYRPNGGRYSGEFARLDQLLIAPATPEMLFDGILSVGDQRRYMQRVRFSTLTIEGYGDDDLHTVRKHVCVQSVVGAEQRVWYRIVGPSEEYARYFEPFAWLADFTKFFVDYLCESQVGLHHFRRKFYDWLVRAHGRSAEFKEWFSQYGKKDFRTVVVANLAFLWKESCAVVADAWNRPLWREVDPQQLGAIRQHPTVQTRTLVTPYVYECFKKMYFSEFLETAVPKRPSIGFARAQRLRGLGFATEPNAFKSSDVSPPRTSAKQLRQDIRRQDSTTPAEYKVGDVVTIPRDRDSVWKDEANTWFAYVQGGSRDSTGDQFLRVLWLYRPEETTLSGATYPIPNELFFSDHCNCDLPKSARLKSAEVLGTVSVRWFATDPTEAVPGQFVVRQTYKTEDNSFHTLRKEQFSCDCETYVKSPLEEVMAKCSIGDTILLEERCTRASGKTLEPALIVDFVLEREEIRVRRLLRRKRDLGNAEARPNELVWTDELFCFPAENFHRRCHVRFYSLQDVAEDRVPAPYNLDGTADCFYVTSRLEGKREGGRIEGLKRPYPTSLNQGFDPRQKPPPSRKKLDNLALFAGGGSFDRGLEDGGAVRTRWAVEIEPRALHTFRANLESPDEVELYLGSVNDYFAKALDGTSRHVAAVGQVDNITAGSPCQGFSLAQQNKMSTGSKRNASMVASVVAFIDFYRPKLALLENVVAMASGSGKNGEQNVFRQVLCALVGMGYQVQQFNLDAWSFGSPQSRSRLFIFATAPGLEVPPHPPLTHSHPEARARSASLGKAANGLAFGSRRFAPTPLEFVSAAEATSDLPFIGDSRVQSCVPFPDHRTSREESENIRIQVACIPTFPAGCNAVKAIGRGFMPRRQVALLEAHGRHRRDAASRSWTRVRPDGLFSTITTSVTPADAFTGVFLHWSQHRVVTVMEARRAQGYPDGDVILGLPAHQWRIIGNSVPRQIAVALGMSLREAWLANWPGDDDGGEVVKVSSRRSLVGCGLEIGVTDGDGVSAASARMESIGYHEVREHVKWENQKEERWTSLKVTVTKSVSVECRQTAAAGGGETMADVKEEDGRYRIEVGGTVTVESDLLGSIVAETAGTF